MAHYKVEWSKHQEPWVIHTPEKLAEFVRGLVTDADKRLPVGARITIDVVAPAGRQKGKNNGT